MFVAVREKVLFIICIAFVCDYFTVSIYFFKPHFVLSGEKLDHKFVATWSDENPSVHADLRPLHYILLWPLLRVRKNIYHSYKKFYVGGKKKRIKQ